MNSTTRFYFRSLKPNSTQHPDPPFVLTPFNSVFLSLDHVKLDHDHDHHEELSEEKGCSARWCLCLCLYSINRIRMPFHPSPLRPLLLGRSVPLDEMRPFPSLPKQRMELRIVFLIVIM